MLVAYVDESGTHGNSAVISVSGLAGTTVEWSRLERPWRQNLETAKLDCFHATDCASGGKSTVGMNPGVRASLPIGLSIAIAERKLVAFGGSIYRDVWDRAPEHLKNGYGNDPYHFCFALVLQNISKWSRDYANGEPVALVVAEQQEYNRYSEGILELARSSPFYNIGHVGFCSPSRLIELQAADHIAFETYQELVAQRKTGFDISAPVRETLKIIVRKIPYISNFYDDGAIAGLMREIEDGTNGPSAV
jgi:hypothetical protein